MLVFRLAELIKKIDKQQHFAKGTKETYESILQLGIKLTIGTETT
jgi:hypothetical protein